MKLPEINALPGCDWTPEKTRTRFIQVLVFLPILAFMASIFNEFDLLERRMSLLRILMSIPSEVFEASYTLVVVTILYYMRRGMQSFYRPLGNLWMAMMVLLSVSAVADLFTIGSDDMISPAAIVSALAICIACGVGLSLGIRLSGSYAGRMAVMARRLKVASIFGIIAYGLVLIMSVMVDGRDEDVLAMFLIPVLPIVITYYILQIRAMITALDLLDKGSELGWCDDIYMPDGTGHPVADELHIPEGAGSDWKPMGIEDEVASTQPIVSRMCKTFTETVRNIDLRGGMRRVINAIRHLASTKAAKYLLCAFGLLALAGICYKVVHKDEVESLFADIDIPSIQPETAVGCGDMRLCGLVVYKGTSVGGESSTYIDAMKLFLSLQFHVEDADSEYGIPATVELSGNNGLQLYGIGFLDDDRLTVYKADLLQIRRGQDFKMPRPYVACQLGDNLSVLAVNLGSNPTKIFSADVSNIAHFTTTLHLDNGDGDNTEYYAEFYEEMLFDRLCAATPTSVYKSDDGTAVRIQMFRTSGQFHGIRAVASGKIVDVHGAGGVILQPLLKDGSLVVENDYYYLGYAKWSKDKLVVKDYLGNEDQTVTMPLAECILNDNDEINRSLSELKDNPLYSDGEDCSEEATILAAVDEMYESIPNIDFDKTVQKLHSAGYDNVSIAGNFSGYDDSMRIVLYPGDGRIDDIDECEYWTIVGENRTATLGGSQIRSFYPQLIYEGDINGNGKDEFGVLLTGQGSNFCQYQLYEFDEEVESNILMAYPIGGPIEVSLNVLEENKLTLDDIVTKTVDDKVRLVSYKVDDNGTTSLTEIEL